MYHVCDCIQSCDSQTCFRIFPSFHPGNGNNLYMLSVFTTFLVDVKHSTHARVFIDVLLVSDYGNFATITTKVNR